MRYKVLISKKALEFIDSLPEKSQGIIKDKLSSLVNSPYPGKRGDKKKLKLPSYELYRMHIARSYTAFCRIYEDEKVVKILDIMTVEM
ncbi:type II toxin-antitoxin system RelE family toxin [Archaeoglobus neptunius]|uniref:type II toxin-antitoxin system RelE family toxin n=1 Tax=Archaeoglobus neptunius TaxID=2798580 RepID=UPI00192726B0|nr:type II toxin-antitoxin system RelE/ParE family toxin [Archaeoglobus neptunius]